MTIFIIKYVSVTLNHKFIMMHNGYPICAQLHISSFSLLCFTNAIVLPMSDTSLPVLYSIINYIYNYTLMISSNWWLSIINYSARAFFFEFPSVIKAFTNERTYSVDNVWSELRVCDALFVRSYTCRIVVITVWITSI